VTKSALWTSLIGFVILTTGVLALNIGLKNTPVLGLDLRGGLSVIYATDEPATQDDLIIVRDLMRGQLESFGIAEPDVRVEGDNIVVDLPGVNDQASAFEALQVSGIVTLRPVLSCGLGDQSSVPGTEALIRADGLGSCIVGDDLQFLRSFFEVEVGTLGGAIAGISDDGADIVIELAPTANESDVDTALGESRLGIFQPRLNCLDESGAPTRSCVVDITAGTGGVFQQGSASVTIDQAGGWATGVDLNPAGEDYWNSLAVACFSGSPLCPSTQLAIVLDDVIQSAPTVNQPDFGGSVQITGSFTEDEARSLVRVLNRGAFPVPVSQQRVETVSATAGQDSLNAAVIAGLIGVALMLTFMVAYYRRLSVVIVTGLIVWGMVVFSLASIVSRATNFALTLAGATGIIVAVGVTVDSYVVFFERLRDEARHGRDLHNAAPRSFKATWRTILSADLVSLLASLILFSLSVGSVKGFALYLGLTTIADLLVCYFFTRPAVFLLASNGWLTRKRGDTREAKPVGALT
jgi:preprotein translocase subunit SecD